MALWQKIAKFDDFMHKHPYGGSAIILIIVLLPVIIAAIVNRLQFGDSSNLEDVKNAQYVIYTSGGEMIPVEYNTVVDMETGYQYRIFEIDGQYVCAPAIDEDGTVYKTVE